MAKGKREAQKLKAVKHYIARATCIFGFRSIDKQVRLKQGDAERAFRRIVNAQSTQTNVPDEMEPILPRITLGSKHKVINITQTACQAEFIFDRDGIEFEKQLAVIQKNVKEFFRCVGEFRPLSDYGQSALVLEIQLPTALGKMEMHRRLYEGYFVQGNVPGLLASLTFQVGFHSENNYFLNFAANVYEIRRRQFDPPLVVNGGLAINIQDVPVAEEGFGLRIDVNDRPRSVSPTYNIASPDELISTTFEFARSKVDEVSSLAQ